MLRIEVESVRSLRFDDGSPVRAASAVAPFGDGWLIAQDDAVHAAWLRAGSVEPVRLVPSVEGSDVFSSAAGTKHLKPDLEAACPVELEDGPGVLLLGSGSTPARMRAALVPLEHPARVVVADLSWLYAQVSAVLQRDPAELNLEGACRTGEVLRWFARGNLAAGVPSASVDVDLVPLLAAVTSGGEPAQVRVRRPRSYDLGAVGGVGLTTTDAVALPDGRLLLSAAAEDTPNGYEDGPVVAAALALLDGDDVQDVVPLPDVDGRVAKVEGLAVMAAGPGGARLLAVVDDDDPERPSPCLVLRVAL